MTSLIVHQINMGDVEDPELYAAEPLYKFEISDKGRWVMENALEPPVWFCKPNPNTFYYSIRIEAKFTEEMATYFKLKWG